MNELGLFAGAGGGLLAPSQRTGDEGAAPDAIGIGPQGAVEARALSEGSRRSEAHALAGSGPRRCDDGHANRMDRVRATGNGQVPRVAALAWRNETMEYEDDIGDWVENPKP